MANWPKENQSQRAAWLIKPPVSQPQVAPAPKSALRRLEWSSWLSLPLLLFLLLPIAVLIWHASPAMIWANLQLPQVQQAIRLSLLTSLAAAALSVLFGTPLAYWLARSRRRWVRLLDSLLDLPIVLPPAVAGIALLLVFGRQGVVGRWLADAGIALTFTPAAVILAQIFVAAPFFVKAAAIGFANLNADLEEAAALDGADSWQIFRFLTLPLTWTALLGGMVMTWARALGEFGATIIFAGNLPGLTQTMPLAIYLGFELDLSIALTLAAILVGASFGVLLLVKLLLTHTQT